jgi:cell division septation protein DedD
MASAAPASPTTPAKTGAASAIKPTTTTTASAAPAPAPSTAAAPAVKANAPAAANAGAGGAWQVQLAAMKSEAEAQTAWKKALAGNKELLGNLTEETVQADLGAKGIYYRVRVGPLDEAAAKTLCAELTKHNQGCIVARK